MVEQEIKKPKLLLLGYRAFGDWIYTCSIFPELFKRYEVYLECNTKGYMLFHDDPRFKKVAYFAEMDTTKPEDREEVFKARWAKLREQVQPDVEINLNGSLEIVCIAERMQDELFLPVGERRKIFGHNGFYDAVWDRCSIPLDPNKFEPNGMYFWPDQEEHVQKWRDKHKDDFVVIMPIAGSTAQKVNHAYKQMALAILEKYPNAFIYLAGDEACRPFGFEHPRVKGLFGNDVDVKQIVHMTKYADMVIGPETFLLVAAGMFGTPKIILSTTSSVWQMAQYTKNDFSIQAPIHCSPCHRAIYYEGDCETPLVDAENKFLATSCSKMFRVEDIINKVDYVYQLKKVGSGGFDKRAV